MHHRLAALGLGLALPLSMQGSALAGIVLQDDQAAPRAESAEPVAPWLEFPDDPIGRLWASVGEATRPWTFEAAKPAAQGKPAAEGTAADSWPRWADALQGLHGDDATRRGSIAELADLARRDGRAADAFAWVQSFGAGDPQALAGALPRLFPGIPDSVALIAGGVPEPMPNAALLRPQIPPIGQRIPGRIVPRRATCRGLVAGDATFELLLKVDGSGVVCELTHVAGGPGEIQLQLPAPDGYRLKSLYLDWEQQPLPDGADPDAFDWSEIAVTVPLLPRATGEDDPGYAESFSVFARLARNATSLPRTPAAGAGLPDAAREVGLELVVPRASAAGDDEPPWDAIADAWSRAAGIPTTVVASTDATPGKTRGGLRGITLRFHEAADPTALRRRITSAIEARCRASQ